MSDFKVGDKVYLECEVREKDNDNTYELKYRDWHGSEIFTYFVANDVLHTTDEFYNKGLNDAWNLAKKIVLPSHMGGYTMDEFKNIFSKNTYISAMSDFTPQEALAKVKAYEEEHNEIKVGDVVKLKGVYAEGEGIVTRIDNFNIYRLFRDGSCNISSSDFINRYFEKTGRRYDSIDEFMRSADD